MDETEVNGPTEGDKPEDVQSPPVTEALPDDFNQPVIAARPRRWALVRAGFIADLKASYDHLRHPFEAVGENERVIDVSGVDRVHVGYIVDAKGNVAPAHGRTEPLTADEPAYHMAPQIGPIATADFQKHLEAGGVEPMKPADKDKQPQGSVEDGKVGTEQRRPDSQNT